MYSHKHINQGVGDEQNFVRLGQHGVVAVPHGRELEERVEGHELDARLGVHRFLRHQPEVLLHGIPGVRVAVAVGFAHHLAVAADAHHVAPPGVDAYRGEADALVGQHLQCPGYLAVEGVDVPIEMAVAFYDVVGETAHFPLPEPAVGEASQYRPAAGGTQVDG